MYAAYKVQPLILSFTLLSSMLIGCHSSDENAGDSKATKQSSTFSLTADQLGTVLLDSIASRDSQAFLTCWHDTESLAKFLETIEYRKGPDTPENIRQIRPKQLAEIAICYDRILEHLALAGGGKPEMLKIKRGQPITHSGTKGPKGVQNIPEYEIQFTLTAAPGKIFTIIFEDGPISLRDDDWRFMAYPVFLVVRDSEGEKRISLTEDFEFQHGG